MINQNLDAVIRFYSFDKIFHGHLSFILVLLCKTEVCRILKLRADFYRRKLRKKIHWIKNKTLFSLEKILVNQNFLTTLLFATWVGIKEAMKLNLESYLWPSNYYSSTEGLNQKGKCLELKRLWWIKRFVKYILPKTWASLWRLRLFILPFGSKLLTLKIW